MRTSVSWLNVSKLNYLVIINLAQIIGAILAHISLLETINHAGSTNPGDKFTLTHEPSNSHDHGVALEIYVFYLCAPLLYYLMEF